MRRGNGLTCRLWYDNWTSYGSLEEYYAANGSTRLGIRKEATLSILSRNGNWRLPPARTEAQLNILTFITTTNLVPEEEDYYEWELKGRKSD